MKTLTLLISPGFFRALDAMHRLLCFVLQPRGCVVRCLDMCASTCAPRRVCLYTKDLALDLICRELTTRDLTSVCALALKLLV